jgi:tetratricopeptide (TPR) repeat protein
MMSGGERRGFLFVSWAVVFTLAIAPVVYAEHLPCRADLDSGDSAYARFDNAGALDRFSRAMGECPENYDAIMKTARAFVDAGEDMYSKQSEPLFAQGLRFADTLRKLFPDSGQSYFLTAIAAANIAKIKTGMQRIPLARIIDSNIRASIVKSPGFAPAHVVLGAYCRQVAEASPVLRALVGIFYGWTPQGTLAESERSLLKATELDPENVYAHLELARTYAAMGRRKEAIGILERMRTFPRAWHQDDTLQAEGYRLLEKLGK